MSRFQYPESGKRMGGVVEGAMERYTRSVGFRSADLDQMGSQLSDEADIADSTLGEIRAALRKNDYAKVRELVLPLHVEFKKHEGKLTDLDFATMAQRLLYHRRMPAGKWRDQYVYWQDISFDATRSESIKYDYVGFISGKVDEYWIGDDGEIGSSPIISNITRLEIAYSDTRWRVISGRIVTEHSERVLAQDELKSYEEKMDMVDNLYRW